MWPSAGRVLPLQYRPSRYASRQCVFFFAAGRRERIYGKKFEEIAFGLKPGEISDVIETEFGYFIVRLDERQPRTEESLESAKSKIERRLQQSKQREAYDAYVEGLKAKYRVKYGE